MALRSYLGVDGNYANTANWTGAAVPTGGDDVVIDNTSTSLTTGLDRSGDGAQVYASFRVTRRYTGSIGSSGNPLTGALGVTDTIIETSGTECWLAFSNAVYAYLAPQTNGDNACQFGGGVTTLGTLHIAAGKVQIPTTTTFGSLTVVSPAPGGTGGTGAGPLVIIPAGCVTNNSDQLIMNGGELQIASGFDGDDAAVHIHGGKIQHTAGQMTRVYGTNGTYQHDDGTIDLADFVGGTWDASQSATERTVTLLRLFGTAFADFRNGAGAGLPTTLQSYPSSDYKTDPTVTIQNN
jgi:hypothetical protein